MRGTLSLPIEKPIGAEKRTNKVSTIHHLVWESNPGHIGGRRDLSPLHQPNVLFLLLQNLSIAMLILWDLYSYIGCEIKDPFVLLN